EKFTGFKEKIIKDNEEQYGKEIREKYGADTIDASNAKLRDMSQEEFQKRKTREDELFTLLEKAVKTANTTSPAAEARREKNNEADAIDVRKAKLRDMSQEECQKMKTIEDELFTLLEKAVKTADPTSPEAEALVEKHKAWLMFSWNTYSKEAHAGLAEMYVADERFVAYYYKKVKDGAQFLRDAIVQHTIYS